jgi:hypothetical protein
MAITSAICNSFKQQLLLGVHDFHTTLYGGDVFKIALYTSSATLDASTTAYSLTNEITNTSGSAYTAGGQNLTNSGTDLTGTAGNTTFSNAVWNTATFTAAGCLIYNSTPSATDNLGATLTNPAVIVLDFGGNKTATAGTFTITMPALGAAALIRIG